MKGARSFANFTPPKSKIALQVARKIALCDVIYPIRVGVLDVVSNSECHEQWRGAAEPLFMALGIWKPSQKHQRGLDIYGFSHIIRYS